MHARNPLFLRDEEVERHLELLILAERETFRHAEPIRTHAGLTESSFRTLYLIQRHPHLAQVELCTILGITKQTLSRHLKDMVTAGFLMQGESSSDRRRRRLQVTEAGQAALARAAEAHKAHLKRAFLAAGPDAVGGFERVLGLLLEAPTRRLLGRAA